MTIESEALVLSEVARELAPGEYSGVSVDARFRGRELEIIQAFKRIIFPEEGEFDVDSAPGTIRIERRRR